MENHELRNNAFIRRCAEILDHERRRGVEPSVRRIVALAVFGGAPGYFISHRHAYKVVSKLHALKPADRPDKAGAAPCMLRALAITEDVEAALADAGGDVSRALTDVLGRMHARRFYFTVEYGIRLFYRHYREYVDYVPRRRSLQWPV